jgi:hypothetical protein
MDDSYQKGIKRNSSTGSTELKLGGGGMGIVCKAEDCLRSTGAGEVLPRVPRSCFN